MGRAGIFALSHTSPFFPFKGWRGNVAPGQPLHSQPEEVSVLGAGKTCDIISPADPKIKSELNIASSLALFLFRTSAGWMRMLQ